MITEDYVSFETAKLLKEKEFDEECNYEYGVPIVEQGYVLQLFYKPIKNSELIDEAYAAPTIQMAMRWLREEYKMHCDIGYDDLGWFWNILDIDNAIPVEERPKIIKNGFAGYNSYEEACETAIKYCLENLV